MGELSFTSTISISNVARLKEVSGSVGSETFSSRV